jgi:hypothetical protein
MIAGAVPIAIRRGFTPVSVSAIGIEAGDVPRIGVNRYSLAAAALASQIRDRRQ